MNEELKDFLSTLSHELAHDVTFEYNLSIDSPSSSWPSTREQYRVCANKHKSIYRSTLKQIFALTKEDFTKEE